MLHHETLQTLIFGSYSNFWYVYNRKTLFHMFLLLLILISYFYIYYSIEFYLMVLDFCLDAREPKLGYKCIVVWLYLIECIPFCGIRISRNCRNKLNYLENKTVPYCGKLKRFVVIVFWKFIGDVTFKNNSENVVLVITGDKLNFSVENMQSEVSVKNTPNQGSTFILSNHRSIFDYALINYLILESKNTGSFKEIYSDVFHRETAETNETMFLSWKNSFNFPTFKLMLSILRNGENAGINEETLVKPYKQSPNSPKKSFVYVLFPEVSVITNQVKTIQDKINLLSDIFLFNNLLYPRFRNFTTLINFLSRVNTGSNLTVKEEEKQNVHNDMFENRKTSSTPDLAAHNGDIPRAHNWFYDCTITYYQPYYMHDASSTAIHQRNCLRPTGERICKKFRSNYRERGRHNVPKCEYELRHITPSVLEMLASRIISQNSTNTTVKMPIIIRVHIEKKMMSSVLNLSRNKLERWLEDDWKEKDKIIDSFDNNIKLVKAKHKKTSLS